MSFAVDARSRGDAASVSGPVLTRSLCSMLGSVPRVRREGSDVMRTERRTDDAAAESDLNPTARPSAALRRATLGWIATLAIGLAAVAPSPASARDDYDPSRSGNPLKIVYYVAYPVLITVDTLIFRPAYFIGSYQPFRFFFGRKAVHDDTEPTRRPEDRDDDR